MAAVNLPDSPANGTTQTVNGITYTYNSSKGYWTTSSSGTTTIQVTTSDSAPLVRQMVICGMILIMEVCVCYADGTSSQWVSLV